MITSSKSLRSLEELFIHVFHKRLFLCKCIFIKTIIINAQTQAHGRKMTYNLSSIQCLKKRREPYCKPKKVKINKVLNYLKHANKRKEILKKLKGYLIASMEFT